MRLRLGSAHRLFDNRRRQILGRVIERAIRALQFARVANFQRFSDFCGGWIRVIDPASPGTATDFATGISNPVDLKVSPDGFLYYLARGAGSVNRITFTGGGGGGGDTTAPTVSITSPANGATVARRTTVTITATATDNVGVTRVEFSVNGALQCTDTSAPYSCNWNVPNTRNQTFQLQAQAFDAAGNVGTGSILVTSR